MKLLVIICIIKLASAAVIGQQNHRQKSSVQNKRETLPTLNQGVYNNQQLLYSTAPLSFETIPGRLNSYEQYNSQNLGPVYNSNGQGIQLLLVPYNTNGAREDLPKIHATGLNNLGVQIPVQQPQVNYVLPKAFLIPGTSYGIPINTNGLPPQASKFTLNVPQSNNYDSTFPLLNVNYNVPVEAGHHVSQNIPTYSQEIKTINYETSTPVSVLYETSTPSSPTLHETSDLNVEINSQYQTPVKNKENSYYKPTTVSKQSQTYDENQGYEYPVPQNSFSDANY